MPKLSLPNRVTITRLLLIVPFVVLVLYQNKISFVVWARYTALGIFVVMAFSDALDGYLARRTGQRSRLGYFLDPLADKLLITAACILLALEKTGVPGALLPGWVVVVIIGKDVIWFVGVLVIQFVAGQIAINASRLGRACTCGQLAMVMGILLYPDFHRVSPELGWWFTRPIWWTVSGLAILTLIEYIHIGIKHLSENSGQAEKTGQD